MRQTLSRKTTVKLRASKQNLRRKTKKTSNSKYPRSSPFKAATLTSSCDSAADVENTLL